MESHYPPPPQPDQQHYNPLYQNQAGAEQLLDTSNHEHLDFSQLGQSSAYPKVEGDLGLDPNTSSQIEARIEQLQHQQPLSPHHAQQEPGSIQYQSGPAQHPDGQSQQETPNKVNRLRKACDSCSIRKVKCDEAGPPCRACSALDIPCTFERPSRRRGPPNRHAESIKRQRLDSPSGAPGSLPSSPTHAAQALAALSSHSAPSSLSAESICSIETVDLLINDYFTYIHPLCPFPHEPSFREAWRRREDYNNRSFLALMASMVAALVASFPRKPRLHLKAQRKDHMFPNHLTLVERCQEVCEAARGPGYLRSNTLSVHDAATSYLLGLAGMYTFRLRLGRLYLGECLNIIRALELHRAREHTYDHLGNLSAGYAPGAPNHEGREPEIVDNITLQMGRRLFWTMFVTSRSISQLGTSFGELLMPPETPAEPYPPLPAEVDDFCIFPTHIDPQPPGLMPTMIGFNANVQIFKSYSSLSVMELISGIDHVVDWDRQKKVFYESLKSCKNQMNDLPPELTLWPTTGPFGTGEQPSSIDIFTSFQLRMGQRDPALMNLDAGEPSPEQRKSIQYEIQKANIYASALCTRSFIVEKYLNMSEAHGRRLAGQQSNEQSPSSGVLGARLDGLMPPQTTSNYDLTEQDMSDERESIIKDLLLVLSSIDRVNMEPNGDSFTHKIRFIASTLLNVPSERKGSVAQQSEHYLKAFLDILVKLERSGPAHSDPQQPYDEEAELRQWADLRDYQMKFAQQGGVLAVS